MAGYKYSVGESPAQGESENPSHKSEYPAHHYSNQERFYKLPPPPYAVMAPVDETINAPGAADGLGTPFRLIGVAVTMMIHLCRKGIIKFCAIFAGPRSWGTCYNWFFLLLLLAAGLTV